MSELVIEARQEYLHDVFDFVEGEIKSRIPDQKFWRQLKLCVEEVYLNIANYAYYPDTGSAVIRVEVTEETDQVRVFLSFSDGGKPFDPLKQEEPDLHAAAEDRTPGGLGIFLLRETVDRIDYAYKDHQNILTFEKDYPLPGKAGEAK